MKTILHRLCMGMVVSASLLSTPRAIAQIDYYEDFSTPDNRWTTQDFERTDIAACDNNAAFRANASTVNGVSIPVETISPIIGTSNGEIVTLSYSYKLLNYDTVLPFTPVNDFDWGIFSLEYGPTMNGPWTEIDAVLPESHTPSTQCATRVVTFTPPNNSTVYLRVVAGLGITPQANYYVYLDGVSAFQETITTASVPLPEQMVTVYPNPVSDFLNLTYDGNLTDIMVFNMQGQQVPMANIERNVNRIDLSTLDYGDYVLKLVINDEVQTIDVTKL